MAVVTIVDLGDDADAVRILAVEKEKGEENFGEVSKFDGDRRWRGGVGKGEFQKWILIQ